jgi:alpha-D-ribose 1-methylphosphonate 5-triphosphate synthase subunit PhnH
MSQPVSGTLESGFVDPVLDSQSVFRLVLDAMARPGMVQSVGDFISEVPLGLQPATAACLLSLADYETPIFLPQWLREGAVPRFLAFHTGASVTDNPAEAVFAVIDGDSQECALSSFSTGDDRYPDKSTTVLVQCALLNDGEVVSLEGPGIKTRSRIAPSELHPEFWNEAIANHGLFPRGVDLIFCAGEKLVATPRSSRIIREKI